MNARSYRRNVTTASANYRALSVALRVERPTRDRGFDSRSATAGATTLGKLLTPLCLCHEAAEVGTGVKTGR